MNQGTSTLERVATPQVTPARTDSTWKRFAIIAAGLGLAAAIGTSAVMVFGGHETSPTVGPVVTGDRDAAWLSSLERQAAAANSQASEQTTSPHTASRDKEEALKQAEARRAAQVTDKEEGLRQAEERRAALNNG